MPTVSFTDEQKAKARHHLGYPGVAEAASFGLGTVAGLEFSFLIERAVLKLLPESMPQVEQILCALDTIEAQKLADLELMAVNQIGEIAVNQGEQSQLDKQYNYWAAALSNILTVPRNPYDNRLAAAGNSINARVAR
jgi:hypothetical protein